MLTLTLKTNETQTLTFSKITALKTALAEAKRKATSYPYEKLAYVIADEQGEIEIGTKGCNWKDDSKLILRKKEKKVSAYSTRKLFHNKNVYQNENYTATESFFELQKIDLTKFSILPWKGTQERTEQIIRNIITGANTKAPANYNIEALQNNGYYDYVTLQSGEVKVKIDARLLKYFLKKYKNVEVRTSTDDDREAIYIYSQNVLVAAAMPLWIK